MTYDPIDGYILLFGGETVGPGGGVFLNDTWTFSGGLWKQLHPSVSPPAPYGFAQMQFDSKDGYAVLLEDQVGISLTHPETWKFAAGVWSKQAGTKSPRSLDGPSVAESPDHYVLLFGGHTQTPSGIDVVLNETWKFVAGKWFNITGSSILRPPARAFAGMTYDTANASVLLFGGGVVGGRPAFNDTWKFHGGNWTKLAPASSPPIRSDLTLSYFPPLRSVILAGGLSDSRRPELFGVGDSWRFVRGDWARVSSPSPSHPTAVAMTFDLADNYTLLFGGFSNISGYSAETWRHTSFNWTPLSISPSPSRRAGASMTYDASDGYVLMFGGYDGRWLNDTWSYLGGVWTNRTSSIGPSPRELASMAFDTKDRSVLLFGGNRTGFLGDTWTYRSGVWRNISGNQSISPSPRVGAEMTYDVAHRSILLFGGYNGTNTSGSASYKVLALNDTWNFTRGHWAKVSGAGAYPAPSAVSGMVYDAKFGHVIEFFGCFYSPQFHTFVSDQTIQYFGGGQWHLLSGNTPILPAGRCFAGFSYDVLSGAVLMFGSISSNPSFEPYGFSWTY